MSDPTASPTKPKVGSLRDRIAAFEKPAAGNSPPSAPVPRPKPGGVSWKPKVPSPPSSPGSTEHATSEKKTGGMSASDAKESIGKGGSLKDRMAALQGKGAFGAPPPVAPKPVVEKPKWKPPPVVAPIIDKDEGAEHPSSESSSSIPVVVAPVRLPEDESATEGHEEETSLVAEAEGQAEADPQEEERQRRAAIAARMARLGGARVGMAPMFGRPPVTKKPESLHVVDDTSASAADNVSQEQTIETTAVTAAAGSSESLSLPSGDPEPQGSRSPNSMPLPSAPRRAGPPRKKPAKSPTPPTPPTADLEVPPTETHDILSTADTPAITKKGKVEGEKAEITTEAAPEIPETRNEERVAEEADTPVEDDSQISDIDDEKSVHAVAPSHAPNALYDVEDDDDEAAYKVQAQVEHEPSEAADQVAKELVEEPADEPEDEETARRKRVAEKFAKMGRINPLSMPVQPKPSTDETQPSPPVSPLTKRASLSMQSATTPPPVQRAGSLRKSSVDSTIALQESPLQRKPTIVETPISVPVSPMLARKASLSRKSTDSLQRKQSLRKSVDSTAVPEEEAPSRSSEVSPPSRKSSVDPTVSRSVPDSVSKRDSQDVAVHIGQVAATRLPEGSEPAHNVQRVRGKPTAYSEESKSVRGKHEVKTHGAADESLEVVDLDNEPATSAPLIIPTPPAPKWTTRPAPVDSLLAEPLPIPPRTLQQATAAAAPPPTRSIPLPPPFLVPQYDDESAGSRSDLEDNEGPQPTSDDEGSPLPRRIPPRLVSNDDNTDSESAPLPIPTRRPRRAQGAGSPTPSLLSSSSRPARRSLPPPPPPSSSAPASDVEHDSDLDEILPTPPRHRPSTPGMPPSNEVPLIVPPPHAEDLSRKIAEPSPLRHSYPSPIYAYSDSGSSYDEDQSPSHLSDSLPVSDQEILDEEEGDPIDPTFHSPSRSGSTLNLDAPQHSPGEATLELSEQEQVTDAAKRATIAERMAKLGGIQFGAAPIPPSFSRPPPPPRPDDESIAQSVGAPVHEEPAEVDEEEERTRKERIAAKLAGMGGMRIGMMPLGPGALRPQQSHVLKEDNETPVPVATAPSQTESDDGMSASPHSLSTSEEGVKVEAEESEMEEVSYEDAEDEAPPPVPTRPTRRSTSEIEPTKAATAATPRPPVPTSVLARRSSVQTTASGRKPSVDSSSTTSPRRSATVRHQSEYVMVEEPKALVAEEVPPPPPARPLARTSSTRETPPRRPPYTSDISSQWELPAIPSSSLGFRGSTDLSLSWSDAGAPDPPSPSTDEKSHPQAHQTVPFEQPLSSDYLIAVWGRVGVQICEVATSLFEKSKKTLVGDGTYRGFVTAVVNEVPNASLPAPPSYGHVIYVQNASAVQKRVNDIMPGDIVELQDAKFKGHKGIQIYSQHVGVGEPLVGVVSEFEPKKSKIRLFQANQHVGQQTVEAVSYRLEDLKSGTLKAYRVLEA